MWNRRWAGGFDQSWWEDVVEESLRSRRGVEVDIGALSSHGGARVVSLGRFVSCDLNNGQ